MRNEVVVCPQHDMVNTRAVHCLPQAVAVKPPGPTVRNETSTGFGFFCPHDSASQAATLSGILELQHHAIMILRHKLECRDRFGIVHVGDQKNQAPTLTNRRQVPNRLTEPGALIEPIPAQLMQPHEHLPA
jgi:hypothetical protein